MTDALRLPHRLGRPGLTCRVVVETPKGSRSKYDYDPESGLFELAGLLPEGMSFPLDFGFIPSTKGEDGDPIDVLVLHDEKIVVGAILTIRLVGVIEAEQTEDGNTVRNDRLLAVSCCSHQYEGVTHVDALGDTFLNHLTRFWVNYNALKGKGFNVLHIRGPDAAANAIEKATS